MSAAEENAILSGKPTTLGASGHRRGAMTLILFLLAALIALAYALVGPSSVSAKTPCAPQNRVWENSAGMLQLRPIQTPQSLELQRENSIGRYNDASRCTLAAENKVKWVDENAHMNENAREYNSGASGARSNAATSSPQAPEITYKTVEGSHATVRFDGQEGDVLIDRKVSVTTFEKSQNQALRQSEALAQNGLKGRWEVPTAAQKVRAVKMLAKLGIKNITVNVVPK